MESGEQMLSPHFASLHAGYLLFLRQRQNKNAILVNDQDSVREPYMVAPVCQALNR